MPVLTECLRPAPVKDVWELWTPLPRPRGMLGDTSGDICLTRVGSA